MEGQAEKDFVLRVRPMLGRVYREHGDVSVAEYGTHVYTNGHGAHSHVVDAIAGVATKALGAALGERVRVTLNRHAYVSTVDHHGPLCHPSFFQPNVLRMALDREAGIPATIVLSCASVSLDNHSFPRGFYFHDESGGRVRVPLFTVRDRHVSVYGARAFASAQTRSHVREAHGSVGRMISDLIEHEAVRAHTVFRSQVAHINHLLMHALYPEGGDFVSISIEEVVKDLLVAHIHEDLFVTRILFDADVRDMFLRETNGVQTSHDFASDHTTVLFWGLQGGVRIPLRIIDGELRDAAGNIRVRLTEECVTDALMHEEMFPNLALCLISLAYYGVDLGGGFLQIDYLPELICKVDRVHQAVYGREHVWGRSDSMGGDFVFIPAQRGRDVTSLDAARLAMGAEDIFNHAKNTRMRDAIDRIIPDAYRILASER